MSIKSAPTNKELSYRLAKSLGNKLKLAFSIKQVKTFGDAFRFIEQDTYGYSTEQLASPITYTQIKDLADSLTIKLDNFYAANDYAILHPREEDKGQPEPSIIISTGTQKIIPAFQEEEVIERKHPPSYKARLYPFQQRAANDLVDDILGRGPNKPDRLS